MNKYIIIGCPRSGTGFASKFFNIGHEKINKNGISSWCLINNPPLYGPTITEVKNIFPSIPIFHQIRRPIDTISSFMSMSDKAWVYFYKVLNLNPLDSKIKNGMEIYYQWNIRAKEISEFTYKLEEIEQTFANIKAYSNKKQNSRKHILYTENDFLNADKILWGKIQDLYELID